MELLLVMLSYQRMTATPNDLLLLKVTDDKRNVDIPAKIYFWYHKNFFLKLAELYASRRNGVTLFNQLNNQTKQSLISKKVGT